MPGIGAFVRAAVVAALLGPAVGRAVDFEVASVKPGDPNPRIGNLIRGGPGTTDPIRFTTTNANLRLILTRAFGVEFDQISGPDWMGTQRFDIEARVPAGATKEQMEEMLRNLLVERFHLTYHAIKKEFPVYELTVGSRGSKLKEAAPEGPPSMGTMATCQGSRLTAKDRDAAGVAQSLRSAVGARVVDKTGLAGRYDVELYYTPDPMPSQMNCADKPADAPRVMEAVQQQLGLRLEKKSAMLDVFVIDHIDMVPTEN